MTVSRWVTIRVATLLTFLVVMPVLAIPQVNELIDVAMFGPGQTTATSLVHSTTSGNHSQAETAIINRDTARAELQGRASAVGHSTVADDRDIVPDFAAADARVERLPSIYEEVNDERFQKIQSRLQSLGAEYIVLDRSSDPTPTYRFHCRLAVPGNAIYSRPFEATDGDSLRAMQRVLLEVESWHATQQGGQRLLR